MLGLGFWGLAGFLGVGLVLDFRCDEDGYLADLLMV